jgi:hypothetical protein
MRVRLGDDRFFERQPVADLRNAAVSVTPSSELFMQACSNKP